MAQNLKEFSWILPVDEDINNQYFVHSNWYQVNCMTSVYLVVQLSLLHALKYVLCFVFSILYFYLSD